jgi:hypothetical protein
LAGTGLAVGTLYIPYGLGVKGIGGYVGAKAGSIVRHIQASNKGADVWKDFKGQVSVQQFKHLSTSDVMQVGRRM